MSGAPRRSGDAGGSRAMRSGAAPLSPFGRAAMTVCGLGDLRPAPGTWGSLPPVAVVLVMLALGAEAWMVAGTMAVVAVVSSLLCLRFGDAAEATFGRKDPSHVVIDETAGQAVSLLLLPWGALGGGEVVGELTRDQVIVAVASFLLFRAFDIVKPPPARGLQRLGGGAGILVDDLLAGLYALGAGWLVVVAMQFLLARAS